mgnify:CR=1 FL=1
MSVRALKNLHARAPCSSSMASRTSASPTGSPLCGIFSRRGASEAGASILGVGVGTTSRGVERIKKLEALEEIVSLPRGVLQTVARSVHLRRRNSRLALSTNQRPEPHLRRQTHPTHGRTRLRTHRPRPMGGHFYPRIFFTVSILGSRVLL